MSRSGPSGIDSGLKTPRLDNLSEGIFRRRSQYRKYPFYPTFGFLNGSMWQLNNIERAENS